MLTHHSWYFKISVIKQKGVLLFGFCLADYVNCSTGYGHASFILHNLSQLNLKTEKMAYGYRGKPICTHVGNMCNAKRIVKDHMQRKVIITTALKQ